MLTRCLTRQLQPRLAGTNSSLAARALSSMSLVEQRRASVDLFFEMYSDGRAMEAERTMLTDDAIWEIYPSTIGSRVGGGLPKQAHMAFMEQTMEGFSNFSIRPFDMVCEGAVVQTNARSEGRHKLVGHFSQ
eukprot:3121549-Prymnesium_polylepis.1